VLSITNVSQVPQLSPFRYPGGKSWLAPYAQWWLATLPKRPTRLCEPFAGGAAVSLLAVFGGLVDRAVLVELDPEIALVWEVILGPGGTRLAQRIESFVLSAETVEAVLATQPQDPVERAFGVILRNRTNYAGIIAAGASKLKRGENDKGLASRWYPKTLHDRIMAIGALADRFTIVNGDGLAYLENHAKDPGVAYFIDPPYTVAGKRLYTHSQIDDARLFQLSSKLDCNFLMTYDSTQEICDLAAGHGLAVAAIAMRNAKHDTLRELLIGRDLSWTRSEILPKPLTEFVGSR